MSVWNNSKLTQEAEREHRAKEVIRKIESRTGLAHREKLRARAIESDRTSRGLSSRKHRAGETIP